MALAPRKFSVYGIECPDLTPATEVNGGAAGFGTLVVPADEDGGDEFGRLVWLLKSNDRLFAALRVSTERLRSVRAYLAEAGCNVFLGKASYAYWRTRRSSVLTLLRANRIEARRLLGRLDPGAFPRCSVSRAALGLSRQTDPPRGPNSEADQWM